LQQRLAIPERRLPQVDWSGQLADNWQSVGKFTAQSLKRITGSGANLLLSLANLALVPVVAFYLMRDWNLLLDKALGIVPLSWQQRTSELAGEADEVVGAFLRGQFLVMCALGAIYSAGLWLVGLQLAMLLGLIAGLSSIVPYLGFMVGIVASLIAAYAQFNDWTMLLWVVLVFGVGQAVESMLLTPILVGDRIGLHPVAVIFVLMAGAQVAGFVGVVLALPVGAVIMVFLRHALQHYRSSELYGGD
jgi:predicted PurR-regulated permease PerM